MQVFKYRPIFIYISSITLVFWIPETMSAPSNLPMSSMLIAGILDIDNIDTINHGLKSRDHYCYRYQPIAFSIYIINIGRQYRQYRPHRQH